MANTIASLVKLAAYKDSIFNTKSNSKNIYKRMFYDYNGCNFIITTSNNVYYGYRKVTTKSTGSENDDEYTREYQCIIYEITDDYIRFRYVDGDSDTTYDKYIMTSDILSVTFSPKSNKYLRYEQTNSLVYEKWDELDWINESTTAYSVITTVVMPNTIDETDSTVLKGD